jgi:tagaturonate reductase
LTESLILNKQNRNTFDSEQNNSTSALPERVLQIGEGNFLRGFIDWMIYEMNQRNQFQGKVVAIQPTPRGKVVPKLNKQDGLYTLVLRGNEQGKAVETIKVIDSINRGINPYDNWDEVLKVAESLDIEFVFSNTTEAGLQYSEEEYEPETSPLSYPGKLVSLLYHRYQFFEGDVSKGWIILPCELVENNGVVLKDICQKVYLNWQLPEAFWTWVEATCVFCNTLVDRIVTGFPHDEIESFSTRLGFNDELLTVAEPYHLFVIEGPEFIQEKLPFKQAGLNVHFDSISSYRELKVKFLNAPHTMLAATGILSGIETVKEGIEDSSIHSFLLNALTKEVSETLQIEVKAKSSEYVKDVIDRFLNPYLHHKLLDISLNGFAKFQTRVMPSLLNYKEMNGTFPNRLVFSLAALISFYKVVEEDGNVQYGQGLNGMYQIRDNQDVIERFKQFWSSYNEQSENATELISKLVVQEMLAADQLDIADELSKEISNYLSLINEKGVKTALELVDKSL